MSYLLGVDLGTTFTAAAVADDGPPTMLGLGNRALQIPSVLFLADDQFLVGEVAERRGAVEPGRLAREFKRRLGDDVPMLVGGSPFSAEALMARLLAWVIGRATERMGRPPDEVILTHPANWGPYRLEVLRQVATLADVQNTRWCTEPTAAAAQYAARARVPVGARLAVYDLGGGTFDVCVLQKTDGGFELLGAPEGVEHLGGADFDEALFRQVLSGLRDHMPDLDQEDADVMSGLARLRRDCVEAKEALSADVDTVIPVSLPGLVTSVRVTRSEFESLIRPSLIQTVAAMERALRSASTSASQLAGIILVGGSSRIPLVGEMLQREFKLPTALDTHPKHDIALGAVQFAIGERHPGRTSGVPPPTSPLSEAPRPISRKQRWGKRSQSSTDKVTEAADPDQLSRWRRSSREVATPMEPQLRNPSTVTTPAVSPHSRGSEHTPSHAVSVGASRGQTQPAALRTPARPEADVHQSRMPPVLLRPRVLLIIAASILLTITSTAVLLTTKLEIFDGASRQPAAPATPGGTSGASSAEVVAVPRSTPLTDTQLIVPMQDGDNWDLYLADVANAAPIRPLTNSPAADYTPTLSPDFATVIYVHDPDVTDNTRTLRVMGAADGADDRQLFDPVPSICTGMMYRPAWSPANPDVLAVPCTDDRGQWGLYLMRMDGTVIDEVTHGQQRVDDPTFSPDGTELAFWAGPQGAFDGGSLFVATIEGATGPTPKVGTTRQLTKATVAGQDADPAWSPDGHSIAYRRRSVDGTTGGNMDIFVVPANGSGKPKALADGPADEQDPSWSRFGNQIAYKSGARSKAWPNDPATRVWIMDKDGSRKRVLWSREARGVQTAPSWSRR